MPMAAAGVVAAKRALQPAERGEIGRVARPAGRAPGRGAPLPARRGRRVMQRPSATIARPATISARRCALVIRVSRRSTGASARRGRRWTSRRGRGSPGRPARRRQSARRRPRRRCCAGRRRAPPGTADRRDQPRLAGKAAMVLPEQADLAERVLVVVESHAVEAHAEADAMGKEPRHRCDPGAQAKIGRGVHRDGDAAFGEELAFAHRSARRHARR